MNPAPAEPAVLAPPADLAAALDADGSVLVRHPVSGARLRLTARGIEEPPGDQYDVPAEELTEEQRAFRASVDRGIAEADAGLGMTAISTGCVGSEMSHSRVLPIAGQIIIGVSPAKL